MIENHRWPCSALTESEMSLLVKWRRRIGLPITKIIKKAINEWDREEEKKWVEKVRKKKKVKGCVRRVVSERDKRFLINL